MKKLSILFISILLCVCFAGCGEDKGELKIDQPQKISTGDEILPAKNLKSVEESPNVNGLRFAQTLDDFTDKYNEISKTVGGVGILSKDGWKKNGGEFKDNNGIKMQYYYYDDDKSNFTATVELESGRIVNVGCATTMNNFVAESDGIKNSDIILKKSAVMAQAACQFPQGSTQMLQNIFYVTTFENTKELWYQGFIFSLELSEDKNDSTKSLMQLRVFPVTDEKCKDWNITDYEEYLEKTKASRKE